MPVTFLETNPDGIPAPWRTSYQDDIQQAIETSRPAWETWIVTTHEPMDATLLTFDFARGTETSRSLTFAPESDGAGHAVPFRVVSQFLRRGWPGGIAPLCSSKVRRWAFG